MSHTRGPQREELAEVMRQVATEAERYLAGLDRAPVRMPGAETAAEAVGGELP